MIPTATGTAAHINCKTPPVIDVLRIGIGSTVKNFYSSANDCDKEGLAYSLIEKRVHLIPLVYHQSDYVWLVTERGVSIKITLWFREL